MRKKVISVLLIALMFITYSATYATSGHYRANINKITEKAKPGEEFKINLSISDFNDVGEGIDAATGKISYNSNVVEVKSVEVAAGWNKLNDDSLNTDYKPTASEKAKWTSLTENDKIISFATTGDLTKTNFDLLTITFNVLNTAKDGDKIDVKVLYLDLAYDNDYDEETLPTFTHTIINSTPTPTQAPTPTPTPTPTQAPTPTPTPTPTQAPTPTPTPADNEDWTDFSNAKYELKKDGVFNNQIRLEITNVTNKESISYHYYISSTNNKPDINDKDIWKDYLSFDETNNLFYAKITKYAELNQDLYISIKEINNKNSTEKIVSYGIKLERPKENMYSNAFRYTMITQSGTQIVTDFTYSGEYDRKTQIKVGKITDTNVLKKIKNEDSSGFSDLLNYARGNTGIYDNTFKIDKNSVDISVESSKSNNNLINLNGLEDGAYYYLYVKTDDENGKFFSNEAVTLGMASIPKDWYIFFYGTSDFKWADFGEANPTPTPTSTPDNTTLKTDKLPQTGEEILTISIMSAAIISGAVVFIKYKKYDF